MTRTEKRLTDALRAAGDAIKDRDLRPLPENGARTGQRRPGRQRWLAPAAAAAAVVGIATFALVAVQHNGPGPASGASKPQVVGVGEFPTGIAVDTATSTAYVAAGEANALSMINTSKCSAASSDCRTAASVPTGGTDPIGVAVDSQTHTVYVVNAGSNTVAVINAAACNATSMSGCAAHPPLVRLGDRAGAEFLAVDVSTDTVYVADTNAGTVSVINGGTCNASDTTGCGQAPATIRIGATPFPIAVDQATNTVYVGFSAGVAMIDGTPCVGVSTAACAKLAGTVPDANLPAGIAVDDAAHTVYVSGESGTVALLNSRACGVKIGEILPPNFPQCRVVATVNVGQQPRGDAFDPANSTLYVANAVSNDVSVLSATTCNATDTAGCRVTPRTFPVGASPRRVAIDDANNSAYVVNAAASTVSVIDSSSCNAATTAGCPSEPPAGTMQTESSCSPAMTEQSSGASAAEFTSKDTEVATGSVAGRGWSLWAEKGVPEPLALESGGLVLGGRWYGMCAGFPNLLETEFIDAGSHGIAYGYLAMPGKLKLAMTPAALQSPDIVTLRGGVSFFIATLAKSACAYPSVVLHAATASGSAMHSLQFGGCEAGHDVVISGSSGEWGPGQAAFSAPGPRAVRVGTQRVIGTSLANTLDRCSPEATSAYSGTPAAPRTAAETEVASGTAGGSRWSLWADPKVSGVRRIENGGLVLNGRWYGLCPGFPNPAEFDLVDTAGAGIAYGYVGNPGDYKITLTGDGALPSPATYRVDGGTFFIGVLPRSACTYKAMQLTAATSSVTDLHHLQFGSCQPGRLVAITESNGSW